MDANGLPTVATTVVPAGVPSVRTMLWCEVNSMKSSLADISTMDPVPGTHSCVPAAVPSVHQRSAVELLPTVNQALPRNHSPPATRFEPKFASCPVPAAVASERQSPSTFPLVIAAKHKVSPSATGRLVDRSPLIIGVPTPGRTWLCESLVEPAGVPSVSHSWDHPCVGSSARLAMIRLPKAAIDALFWKPVAIAVVPATVPSEVMSLLPLPASISTQKHLLATAVILASMPPPGSPFETRNVPAEVPSVRQSPVPRLASAPRKNTKLPTVVSRPIVVGGVGGASCTVPTAVPSLTHRDRPSPDGEVKKFAMTSWLPSTTTLGGTEP